MLSPSLLALFLCLTSTSPKHPLGLPWQLLGPSVTDSDRYSILPAMSLEGILHCDVQVRAYTAEAFDHFIAALLTKMNHFPQKNSVLVMDNTLIHKSVQLVQMCEDR